MNNRLSKIIVLISFAGIALNAYAQRADENVITSAENAFGTTLGSDSIGLYDSSSVRGFSPTAAGNIRIEGLYFDQQATITSRVQLGSNIRVGPDAQNYPFPAPTGIVDISLRTSSTTPILSAIATMGPNNSPSLELDGQLALLGSQITTSIGVAIEHNNFGNGGNGRGKSFGVVPRWHPTENIELVTFWGRSYKIDETAPPIYISAGPYLPPIVQRGKYPGPSWDTANSYGDNAGVLGLITLDAWTLRAGLFHSLYKSDNSYANIFLDVVPTGFGDHVIFADPSQRSASTSGETRISRVLKKGSLQQLLIGSVHWRNVLVRYGGSDAVDEGIANINNQLSVAKPIFNFGTQTHEHITQQSIGIAYGLQWDKIGELGLGLQRTKYSKVEAQPDLPITYYQADPWLQNATLAINIGSTVVVYGSYTRGLEDSGVAPDTATNRGQPLPAIKTLQQDIGLRWTPTDSTKLIIGYFDISKPYLTTDSLGVYRQLGDETHRGVEISLSISPIKGMTMIVGGVFSQPLVSNVSDANETIGRLPVGQPRRSGQVNINYTLPFATALSVDIGLNSVGSVTTTVDNTVQVPAFTSVALGSRYKFKVRGKPYTFRVAVNNATNIYAWIPVDAGAYQPNDKVAFSAYLAADF